MSVTDQMAVVYPVPDSAFDDELRKLREQHPGLATRAAPAIAAAKVNGRRAGRSLRRGWARVRGVLGSLAGLGTATAAAFQGAGLVPGMVALAVSFVVAEWLLR